MGAYWLLSLPDVLGAAGLQVDTYDGWEVRARSTGGYDDVRAVQVHHTASDSSPASDMAYMWTGSPDRPVGAIYLARDGRLTVGAAGATNTSGKGGPRNTSRGQIPLDAGNKYVISIEAASRGDGELWPDAQLDAYVTAVAALNAAYGLDVGDCHAHWEWCEPNYPGRKIDPAGTSRYADGANSWDMDQFRQDIAGHSGPLPPDPEEDDMKLFCCTDSYGTVWVGDGITRRSIGDYGTWELMVLQSSLGSGPPIHLAAGNGDKVTDPGQVTGYVYDPPLLDSIGATNA